MRNLIILLAAVLCSSCAQLPLAAIPPATPKQAQAVVFDIDGTLTPHLLSIFEARIDAADAVRIFAEKGYKIIYLSTRSRWLQARIPGWLDKNGFPRGSLYLAQTDEDHRYPDVFKRQILQEFIDKGWNVEFAYGDSHTDFVAYALVRIPKERVFALLPKGETSCQPGDWKACLTGWAEHLDFVRKSVPSVPEN